MEFNWNDPNLDWKDQKVIEQWEYRDDGRCWGCGHLKGQEHAEMCDVERCKDCGNPMICCMCAKTEVCVSQNSSETRFVYPFQEKKPLKWTKFSENKPEFEWVWASDFKTVLLLDRCSSDRHSRFYPEWVWAEAEIMYPDVPDAF